MEMQELSDIVIKLEEVHNLLRAANQEDTRFMPFYIEYWVANELMKIGYNVHIVNRKSYDLLLPKENTRIEVKSGKWDGPNAAASFGKGSQIAEGKFDYCVFVAYEINYKIFQAMIFSREELVEVAGRPRPHFARYPKKKPMSSSKIRRS